MGGRLAVMLALEGLGREGVLQTKDQSRPGPLAGGLGWGAVGTMAVALGTLGFIVTKGATQGGGSSTRLSQVIT